MADSEGVIRDRLFRGSLVDAFAARAAMTPSAPAVHDRIGTLAYADLANAAFGIGHRIVDRLGVGSEPVLILMSQGARAIAATLGVLSAGKYYVPFDQRSPIALLRDVVTGVRPRLVLADPDSADMAADLAGGSVIVVAELDAATAPRPPVDQLDPAAAAYIYFTSGSTGQPKGVVDTHHNVLHNAFRYITTLGFDAADCMSLIQSPAGSAVVGTQFGALCSGAALSPVDFVRHQPQEIKALLAKNRITVFHGTSTIFQFLTEFGLGSIQSLRLIRLEGDRATSTDVALLRKAYGSNVVMVNGLGITECGLVRQFFIRPGDDVPPGPLPVGCAVPDVEISIAQPSGAEAPVGSEGEVVVRSSYLAEGYWNDPERTAASFARSADGERTYRTGDIGRLSPDGRLHLVGRIDDQVKVRGATLNLGTVEAIILAQPGVTGAVVVLEEGRDSVGLVAQVTCEPGAALDSRRIRSAILEHLPTAAIPIVRQVETLPTTAAGKLARRRDR